MTVWTESQSYGDKGNFVREELDQEQYPCRREHQLMAEDVQLRGQPGHPVETLRQPHRQYGQVEIDPRYHRETQNANQLLEWGHESRRSAPEEPRGDQGQQHSCHGLPWDVIPDEMKHPDLCGLAGKRIHPGPRKPVTPSRSGFGRMEDSRGDS